MSSRNVVILQLRNPVGKEEPLPVLRVYDDIHMLRLKRAFFEDTLYQVARVENADIKIAVAPPSRSVWGKDAIVHLVKRFPEDNAIAGLAARTEIIGQGVAPIEERSRENLELALKAGYRNIVLMSGYVPTVRSEQVADALRYLSEHKIILGPTIEGGCYLVVMRSDCPEAASLVSIGTDTSYRDTTEALGKKKLKWQEIDLSYDISHQEDIEFIVREINHARFTGDEEIGQCTEAVLSEFMDESEKKAKTAGNGRKRTASDE